MTSDRPEIRPALSRQEWERGWIERERSTVKRIGAGDSMQDAAVLDGGPWDGALEMHNHLGEAVVVMAKDKGAIAALCLDGVLRHEHLEALDDIFAVAASELGDGEYVVSDRADAYRELREIVAALLPPREEGG